jgi:hypothetical protein
LKSLPSISDRYLRRPRDRQPERQPWLGRVRYEELLDQYVATSAQYEAPRELGVFPTFEEALQAVELDAISIQGRREYAAQVVNERRQRRARALARAA